MNRTKKFYKDNLTIIPITANPYIYNVLEDNKAYPDNTDITIYPDGGLSINRHYVIEHKLFDANLPKRTKITCPTCNRVIANGFWFRHRASRAHYEAKHS